MIQDTAIPPSIRPSSVTAMEVRGVGFTAACWSPADLERLMDHLAQGGDQALHQLEQGEVRRVWTETVTAFLDPTSVEREALDPALTRLCGLSPPGLQAALDVVLGGVTGTALASLGEQAKAAEVGPSPLVTILSSNLPGLAVQPLLPALMLGQPILLKSPSAEPLFAPTFVRALIERQPILAEAVAAVTWPGGDRALEAPVIDRAGRILAYGDEATIDSLEQRAPGRVYPYGPKTSLAVLGSGVDETAVAGGLTRDITLFDQRGCLSIQAIYTAGDAVGLARSLATELSSAARKLPPGPPDPVVVAAVQQIRMETALRGLFTAELPLETGTVVVEPQPEFRPSPGLRTIRIHPLKDLGALPELLAPRAGQLQGAALSGTDAWDLKTELESLGVSRCTEPGQLQAADATWHNGGIHPFEALTGRAFSSSEG